MKRFLSYFHPRMSVHLAYMLQQVEYNPHDFMRWVLRMPDLTRVMHRQKLVKTAKARLLVAVITVLYIAYMTIAGVGLIFSPISGIISLLLAPPLIILVTYIIVMFAWELIEEPRRQQQYKLAEKMFKAHPGITIAITGSYGKTSMKELLNTVLSESKKVAATPGNKNVPISHARWVKKLSGEEEILLVEFGEGAPGDVKKLAKLTHPDIGIITGLAPNHLDKYKTLENVAKDLLSITSFIDPKKVYINTVGNTFSNYDISELQPYSETTALGWQINHINVDIHGTSFEMKKSGKVIKVKSGLMGRHQVAPLALVAALAHKLGMKIPDIETGLSKTTAFEHRMQPRQLQGAWIIDDTYNGSLEGIRAGLGLLAELKAKRKIYVTPGLVDQGEETERVHYEIGKLIALAKPDRVVLMQNSSTKYIQKALEEEKFAGSLVVESDPLAFYTSLDHVVAAGDVVMLQNDWTDNYS